MHLKALPSNWRSLKREKAMGKKMLPRFTALALAVLLAAGLAACSSAASEDHTPPPRQESYAADDESPAVQESAPEQPAAPEPETAAEPAAEPDTGDGPASTSIQERLDRIRAALQQSNSPAADDSAANAPAADDPAAEPGAGSGSSSDSIRERLDRIRAALQRRNSSAADDSAANATDAGSDADISAAAAIAKLAELTGTGELSRCREHDTVDVGDSHNPYDLVWQYGDPAAEKGDDFGKFYASYVDAADWSLVFDAEYYKKAFPMLAKLYHEDDALLLEHFQTVGVHEGRQGCEGFNVSVYMLNCSRDLLDAFGDNYECYYFYYMLNYAAESTVNTAGTYGKDPLWLSLELTAAQKYELDRINWYRDEVDAEPLELDPENIAFANYRAWYNAVNSLRGHGWMEDMENPDVDIVFDLLGVDHLGENTVTKMGTASENSTLMPYSASYRASPSHYEAMVRPGYRYLGVSHMYYNGDTNWMCEFDTFLYECPVPDYTMR